MSAQWQMFEVFVWQSIHPAVGVGNVHATVCLPSGGFWECLHNGQSAQWQILGMFRQWPVCPVADSNLLLIPCP